MPLADILGPLLANPNLQRQVESAREAQFLAGIRNTPWFKEFVAQYGEEPNLGRSADYDYRTAWRAGIRPVPDPHDNNRYHWPSSLSDGTMLKAPNHPTAWKEHYMRMTGRNPDADGATLADFQRMSEGR